MIRVCQLLTRFLAWKTNSPFVLGNCFLTHIRVRFMESIGLYLRGQWIDILNIDYEAARQMAMSISNSNSQTHWDRMFGTSQTSSPREFPALITRLSTSLCHKDNAVEAWTWPTLDSPKRENSVIHMKNLLMHILTNLRNAFFTIYFVYIAMFGNLHQTCTVMFEWGSRSPGHSQWPFPIIYHTVDFASLLYFTWKRDFALHSLQQQVWLFIIHPEVIIHT